MAQPLEDPSPSSRYPPCTMMSNLSQPFGLTTAVTGPRLCLPPPPPLPLPPPPPGACPPHPMLMLQWMRSLFTQQPPPPSQPTTSSPSGSVQPSFQSLYGVSEAAQMAGLLNAAKSGAAPRHGSTPSLPPQPPPPLPALNPFGHESIEWHHTNQVREMLHNFFVQL